MSDSVYFGSLLKQLISVLLTICARPILVKSYSTSSTIGATVQYFTDFFVDDFFVVVFFGDCDNCAEAIKM